MLKKRMRHKILERPTNPFFLTIFSPLKVGVGVGRIRYTVLICIPNSGIQRSENEGNFILCWLQAPSWRVHSWLCLSCDSQKLANKIVQKVGRKKGKFPIYVREAPRNDINPGGLPVVFKLHNGQIHR